MVTKWLILGLLSAGLVLLLYSQYVSDGKQGPDANAEQNLIDSISSDPVTDNGDEPGNGVVIPNDSGRTESGLIPSTSSDYLDKRSSNLKRVVIFGRVVDEYHQPVENVLISENRYLYNTRSNSNGQYRFVVELARHKLPMLSFLRTGYEAFGYDISEHELNQNLEAELDVKLVESSESIQVSGWIGNEIGENLPDRKISIFSRGRQATGNFDQTVVSDENGEFVFEAVRPDIDYELEVYTPPDYQPFSLQELVLTRSTPRLNITLKKLKFIQVSGMFVDIDGAPVPNFETNIINISTGIHVQKIVSDSSGFFSLENFPAGEMRFSSMPPEHFKITGLRLSENEYKNLILVVDKGLYQISGWVSDANGVAVNRAMVMLDAEVLRDGIKSVSNRSTVTSATGYFYFDQLADTPHQITVYAKGFDKKQLLHQFRSPASELHIALSPQ